MATDWDEDGDEIVVDDKPREDGLTSEEETSDEPARALRSASPELEQIASAIPRILEQLETLVQPRSEPDRVEDRVSEAFNDLTSRMDALMERLDGLEERLEQHSSLTAQAVDDRSAAEGPAADAATELAATGLVAAQFGEQLTSRDEPQVIELLVFGKELCEDDSLEPDRQRLIDGVFDRQAAAIGLAARLMLVHAAGSDDLPPLLKELGEAYYRWQPKEPDVTDALEGSLVEVLKKRIAAVGLRNSIEIIEPGDRYDASRHVSPDRGVEVAEVRGWAVLRDNGKPLTKASVGLR